MAPTQLKYTTLGALVKALRRYEQDPRIILTYDKPTGDVVVYEKARPSGDKGERLYRGEPGAALAAALGALGFRVEEREAEEEDEGGDEETAEEWEGEEDED